MRFALESFEFRGASRTRGTPIFWSNRTLPKKFEQALAAGLAVHYLRAMLLGDNHDFVDGV
jgi:hypothetical protein